MLVLSPCEVVSRDSEVLVAVRKAPDLCTVAREQDPGKLTKLTGVSGCTAPDSRLVNISQFI